jgi:hypothetical protein
MTASLLFKSLRLTDVHQNLARNIVSIRHSQDLFDDLSTDPQDQEVAIQHELATKPWPYQSKVPVIDRPFEAAKWIEAVAYPFQPPNWSRSRFSDESFGIWYGADQVETTVFETIWHWRQGLLADAGFDREGVSIERKVYLVRCDAALVDFRPEIDRLPALVHPVDYGLTQQAGQRLHKEGFPGLASRSARCKGDVFGILNPAVLSGPQMACCLNYRIVDGRVQVERETGTVWMTV